jgi:hypothetical protein
MRTGNIEIKQSREAIAFARDAIVLLDRLQRPQIFVNLPELDHYPGSN